ncbi:hypothetical protein ACFFJX_06730 [Pseudarcicella hirudinis]|uniref:hypothetical protein n=1 Tax=Pseudarcicella hirudinis TaxID=1079859 RepID=UPI0035EE776E
MWNKIADLIIKYRVFWIVLVLTSTGFMGYQASKIELSYNFSRILPADDPIEQEYQHFRKLFGEDGSIMVIGWQSPGLYELDKFKDWYKLTEDIRHTEGIRNVLSLANLYKLERNDEKKTFDVKPLLTKAPESQAELDTLRQSIESLRFYEGVVINRKTNTTLMAITFNDKDLNSFKRIAIVDRIRKLANDFSVKHKTELHYSGMPFIRTATMLKVSGEMKLFMGLAVLVTGLIYGSFSGLSVLPFFLFLRY